MATLRESDAMMHLIADSFERPILELRPSDGPSVWQNVPITFDVARGGPVSAADWNLVTASLSHGQLVRIASPEEQAQAAAECERRKEERKAADERANSLLLEAGPEGVLLANQEAALIPSNRFPALTYGIVPRYSGKVHVFHERLGNLGDICIQPEGDAPMADVLLTRLLLCRHDEERLWCTGNWEAGIRGLGYYLPKQIREWMDYDGDD